MGLLFWKKYSNRFLNAVNRIQNLFKSYFSKKTCSLVVMYHSLYILKNNVISFLFNLMLNRTVFDGNTTAIISQSYCY